jgi:hypothetical protein
VFAGARRSSSELVGVCRSLSEFVGGVSENVGEYRRMSESVVDFCEVQLTPGLAVVILGVPEQLLAIASVAVSLSSMYVHQGCRGCPNLASWSVHDEREEATAVSVLIDRRPV